ncbi:hypothetical protein B0H67DRAFT_248278 [Lasiosphaeris hirsuta]|uniref:Uncharacterized protein n=1 Tax=Lasiosphaeris hirsuta TaxID=260670 RepID=A0AA40AH71_9PEZI|nr:hypothetical protein B0H67DRAFT_248278 [Lasiosphaeris hirsuta]
MRPGDTMGSIFLSNEELGKKDDDHKPTKMTPIRAQWNTVRVPPRKTLKRVGIALAVGFFVYIFIMNIPTDVPIRDRRRPVYHDSYSGDGSSPAQPKSMPVLKPLRGSNRGKPKANDPEPVPASGYNGPVIFRNLAVSLHAISSTGGAFAENKNILFAASSLKSAALLLPMACQMGAELRSYVHFAIMSRNDIAMDDLRTVNSIDESCQIIFHDARPDFTVSSTETRHGNAVTRAMFHINSYMHPQAVIVDSSPVETRIFLEAMRVQVSSMNVPLIELPEDAPTQLAWITKLDSSSLAAWDKLNMELLVHAGPGTSGNLIRLLKSLTAADFAACSIPHLTIELPNNVDAATAQFLETFQWPPATAYNPTHARQLTLRHRIKRSGVTEDESSIRFLESFWPTDLQYSHVVILSPQAELSPRFYHYLKYTALEYMHSNAAIMQQWDTRLFGISLDLPATHLNATEAFVPPLKSTSPAGASTSFLWQAPNSNAALYAGSKWVELHAFVSRLLEHQRNASDLDSLFTDKLVSKRYPSWLEHALKLARTRGYWTLYPSEQTAANLAAVHSELYRAPEEYEAELPEQAAEASEVTLATAPLLDSLPGGSGLSPFDEMPLLLWDGVTTELTKLDEFAAGYTKKFRAAVGGCEGLTPSELIPKRSTRDLFCSRED